MAALKRNRGMSRSYTWSNANRRKKEKITADGSVAGKRKRKNILGVSPLPYKDRATVKAREKRY